MHQKCIRNVSEIYPKLKLLSLDLSHSNTIKSKQAYIFLPILPIIIPNLSQIQPSLPISHLLKYCKNPKCIPNLLADENGLKLDQIPQYLGISPIKLKIIFPVYISR